MRPCRYAFVLTGTPIENRIDDLYSIVNFIDPARLGSLFRFNREYYEFDDRGRPAKYKNLDRLHERVRPLMMRRLKSDVETELPDRSDKNLFVPMTRQQTKFYKQHEQQVSWLLNLAERRPLKKEELDFSTAWGPPIPGFMQDPVVEQVEEIAEMLAVKVGKE